MTSEKNHFHTKAVKIKGKQLHLFLECVILSIGCFFYAQQLITDPAQKVPNVVWSNVFKNPHFIGIWI